MKKKFLLISLLSLLSMSLFSCNLTGGITQNEDTNNSSENDNNNSEDNEDDLENDNNDNDDQEEAPQEIVAEKIELERSQITLLANETYQIVYKVLPKEAVDKDVIFTVSNKDVCEVSEEGLITAKNYNGSTFVTCSLKSNPAIKSSIRVTSKRRVMVESLQCSVDEFIFHRPNKTIYFNTTVFPLNASDKSVDIYIEDETVAKLNYAKDGVISVGNGTTNLIIKSLQTTVDISIKIPIIVDESVYQETTVDHELSPSRYLSYKDMMGTSNVDYLPSIASKEDPEHVLVIPVEFSNISFDSVYGVDNGEEIIKSELEKAFNGTSEDTNYWESVASYFETSSFGKLNFQFDISDVITSSYSTQDIISEWKNGGNAVGAVVQEALTLTKQNNADKDFSIYDKDKDGLFDSVWLIYSAHNYSNDYTLENCDQFWAFCTSFAMFLPDLVSPGIAEFGWASYDFMYKKGEDKIDAHTYIHETGHLLGLMDYYNYAGGSAPLGIYDMQDCNVGDHNVWTKAALGWLDPIIIDTSKNIPAKIHLKPREDGGAIFICNGYNNTAFDEFLVLELYTNNGLNELDSKEAYEKAYGKMPSIYGVKMYHVDARLISAIENNRQVYYDLTHISEGAPDNYITIGASNTSDYSRNKTVELFKQIELVSVSGINPAYSNAFAPFTINDLFQTNDVFDMNSYSYFTYLNNGKLNNGKELNIEIYFENVSEDGADILIDNI